MSQFRILAQAQVCQWQPPPLRQFPWTFSSVASCPCTNLRGDDAAEDSHRTEKPPTVRDAPPSHEEPRVKPLLSSPSSVTTTPNSFRQRVARIGEKGSRDPVCTPSFPTAAAKPAACHHLPNKLRLAYPSRLWSLEYRNHTRSSPPPPTGKKTHPCI